MIRAVIKEKVPFVAVDGGKWSVREIRSRMGAPKINPIMTCHVEVSDGMLEAVIMMLSR